MSRKQETKVTANQQPPKLNFRFNVKQKHGDWLSYAREQSHTIRDNGLDGWRIPENLGGAPREVKMAWDSAFQTTSTLLEHALDGAFAMGLPTFLGFPTLVGLSQHPLIRAGVEARTNSMTAKWGTIVAHSDVTKSKAIEKKIEILEKRFKKFKVKERFNRGFDFCGYFGGGYLFIDTGAKQEELANPLILDKKTYEMGSLRGFREIEPYLVCPGPYNASNPLASDYFIPQVFYVQGVPVHRSRLVIFKENELPIMLRPAYNFVGISLAQRALDAVCHYTESREAMVRMLLKCSTIVFKSDMSDIFNGDVADTMDTRIKYFVQNRDNDGVAVIDREREDLSVLNTSLGGMSEIVQRCQEDVCAQFHEPAVKMFGLSPSGFSTGEVDLHNHNENIMITQERIGREPIDKVLRVIQMDTFGEVDESLEFDFAPLNEQDEATKLQNEATKANIEGQLLQFGAISVDDIRARLLKDEDSGYASLGKKPQDPNAQGQDPMAAMMGGGQPPDGQPPEGMPMGEQPPEGMPPEMMAQMQGEPPQEEQSQEEQPQDEPPTDEQIENLPPQLQKQLEEQIAKEKNAK